MDPKRALDGGQSSKLTEQNFSDSWLPDSAHCLPACLAWPTQMAGIVIEIYWIANFENKFQSSSRIVPCYLLPVPHWLAMYERGLWWICELVPYKTYAEKSIKPAITLRPLSNLGNRICRWWRRLWLVWRAHSLCWLCLRLNSRSLDTYWQYWSER